MPNSRQHDYTVPSHADLGVVEILLYCRSAALRQYLRYCDVVLRAVAFSSVCKLAVLGAVWYGFLRIQSAVFVDVSPKKKAVHGTVAGPNNGHEFRGMNVQASCG